MYLMCLVYVFNVVNHFYYNSVFHVSISSLKYKANIIDSKNTNGETFMNKILLRYNVTTQVEIMKC